MVAIVAGNGLGLQGSSALGLGSRGTIGDASFGKTGEKLFVNAATGNLVVQDQDELLFGQGVNTAIRRAYNSQGVMAGDHWRPGSLRTVEGLTGTLNSVGSTVTRTDWDGSAVVFQYDATRNAYVASAGNGARETLTFNSATNAWTWNDPASHLVETYDAARGGRLTATTDRDNNAVTYAYNAAGLLSSVKTASGDVTYLDYDSSNQLTQLRSVYRNASGNLITATTVRYAYDAQHRLSQVVTDLSPEDNRIADGNVYTTTYTYDGSSTRIASITQTDGSKVEFTYLQVGGEYRVATIGQTSETGIVRLTRLVYESNGRQTSIIDPLGQTSIFRYDASGRLTQTVFPATTGDNVVQTVTYDSAGNIASVRGNGQSFEFRYDAHGNMLSQVDGNGHAIKRTYSADDLLLTETSYSSLSPDVTASPQQSAGAMTTRYVYDSHNHLRFKISAEGRVTEFQYAANGQQVSVITYTGLEYRLGLLAADAVPSEVDMTKWASWRNDKSQGTRIDTTYDFRGNVASTIRYARLLADGTGDANVPSSDILQTRFVYDGFGRLLQRYTGPANAPALQQFSYDGLGRLLSDTHANGDITLYKYDDASNQTRVTFSNGLTRTSTYNNAGELIAVAESAAGKILSQTTNAYDSNGRLRMSTNAVGQRTYYLYDPSGRRVAEIDPSGALTEHIYLANSVAPVQTTRYANAVSAAALAKLVDANGRPVETISIAGTAFALQLDNAGVRPVTSGFDRREWNVFNDAGQIVRTINADGLVKLFEYDGAGRLQRVTECDNRFNVLPYGPNLDVLNKAAPMASTADRVTQYVYDQDNLLRAKRDANGYVTEYRYNESGYQTESIRYSTVTSQLSTPTLANLLPSPSASDIHEYRVYDGRGLMRAEIDGEGYLTRYQYDAFGNVSQRVRGQQITLANMTQPQQVKITFQAKATRLGAAWPVVRVMVDGLLMGTVKVDSTGYATYTVNAKNIVPFVRHTVDLVFLNGDDGQSTLTIREGMFGDRPFATDGTVLFDGNTFVLDGVDQIALSATEQLLTRSGAARYALDAATTINLWSGAPGEIERTDYAYDVEGNLISRIEYSAPAIRSNELTTYQYDAQGRLLGEKGSASGATYRYDVQGRLIGQLSGEGSAALAALGSSPSAAQIDALWKSRGLTYAYDAAGQRTSMIDAAGNRTLYFYNASGRLTHVVNAAGEIAEYRYNSFGDITQTIQYGMRAAASALATLSGGAMTPAVADMFASLGSAHPNSITSFAYAANGTISRKTDALGLSTDYAYNLFGELVSVSRPLSSSYKTQTTYQYDRLGHITQQTVDSGGLNLTTRNVYDAFGRVIETTDANNVTRTNQYDRNGNVVVITDGTGHKETMKYNVNGHVVTHKHKDGNYTYYVYSAFDRQLIVRTPEGVSTKTTFDATGRAVEITDERNKITRYRYDLDGNLQSTQTAAGTEFTKFDAAGRAIESVNAVGTHTTYTYDAGNRILSRTVDSTGIKLVTTYEYDAMGKAVRVTDPSGSVTETQFDLEGHAILVTTDAGVGRLNLKTRFAYDGTGNVLSVTEGAGTESERVTEYVYDKAGRLGYKIVDLYGLALTTEYRYDANGNVTSSVDPSDATTRFVYDAENRLIYSVSPAGAVVRTDYDVMGNVTGRTSFSTAISVAGLPTKSSANNVLSRVIEIPASDRTVNYVYDLDNRLRFIIDAAKHVTEQTYDLAGNVTRVTSYAGTIPVGTALTVSAMTVAIKARSPNISADDRITRSVFDADNRLVYRIDAANTITRLTYDAVGNVVKETVLATKYPYSPDYDWSVIDAWSASVANAGKDRTTGTFYDAVGRVACVMDAEGYVTAYSYDGAGRVTKTVWHNASFESHRSDSLAQLYSALPASANVETAQRYDTAGRLLETVDPMGVVTHYELDALGQAVNTYFAYKTAAQTITHRVFDHDGRIVEETLAFGTSAAATTRYEVDAMGRVTRTIDPRGVELAEQDTEWALAQRKALGFVDASGNGVRAAALSSTQRANLRSNYATRNVFDALGRVIETIDPLGYSTRTTYDTFGNAVVVTDKAGFSTTYFYDRSNDLVLQITAEGSAIRTEYNAFGKPIKITHYDVPVPAGARAWRADASTVPITANAATDAVTQLVYDKVDRLIKSIDAEGYIEVFTYDGFGNRTGYQNKLGGLYSYTYDRRGLMLSETLPIQSWGRSVINRFEYDARGNRTRTIEVSGLPEQRTTRYEYDALGRQISQTGENVDITDADGRLMSRATPTEKRSYDARGNLIKVVDAGGHAVTYYYDAADRKTGQVSATGTLTLWTYDAVGNVIVTRTYADPVSATVGGVPPTPVNAANVRETRQTYNANNWLIASRVVNVVTGQVNTFADRPFLISEGDVVRMWEYDARGAPVVAIDGYGNRTLSFYNGVGFKILEVDAEGYATAWARNANGDVTKVTAFSMRYPDPISSSDRGQKLIDSWPRTADDRVTNYQWDRNGRMVREERTGGSPVAYSSVSNTGMLSERFGTAVATYSYDGEGHLLRQTDANGSVRQWEYDFAGRQTKYLLPQFSDYANNLTRASVTYEYDGLSNVIHETGTSAGRGEFVYTYGTGGRLVSKLNVQLNFNTRFGYDVAGNTVLVSYERADADGAITLSNTHIAYDAENREKSRVAKMWNVYGTALLSTGTLHETRYNAFGEVTGRRTGGGGPGGSWQEYAEYNNAGMVVRTNFDDGISHVFMYDQNGNATLKMESQKTDLRTWDSSELLDIDKNVDLNQTWTQYDKVGHLTAVMQPKVSLGAPHVSLYAIDIQIDGGQFANTVLTVGGWVKRPPAPPMVGPALTSEAAGMLSGGNQTATSTVKWTNRGNGGIYVDSISIDLPELEQAYGAYGVEVRVRYTATQSNGLDEYVDTKNITSNFLPGNPKSITVPISWHTKWPLYGDGITRCGVAFSYVAEIYVTSASSGQAKLIGSIEKPAGLFNVYYYGHPDRGLIAYDFFAEKTVLDGSATFEAASNLMTTAKSTLPTDARATAYYRSLGSGGSFQILPRGANSPPNSFQADTSGLSTGSYEVWFVATDANGVILRRDSYVITIPASGAIQPLPLNPTSLYSEAGFQYDPTGTYVWHEKTLELYAPRGSNGVFASSLLVHLRPAGTSGWTKEYAVARNPQTGAFSIDMSAFPSAAFDVQVDLLDASGTLIDKLEGPLTVSNDHASSIALEFFGERKTSVTFRDQPPDTDHVTVSYVLNGKRQTRDVPRVGNDFVWDTTLDGLLPDPTKMATYAIDFTAFDKYGTPLSMGRGEVTIGTSGNTNVFLAGSSTPTILEFKPQYINGGAVTTAQTLSLHYRPTPHKAADYDVPFATVVLTRNGEGRFLFDGTDLPTSTEYEFRYVASDAQGKPLTERDGFFRTGTRTNPSTVVDIKQEIKLADLTIDRFQEYNAFGDVVKEIDGRKNVTELQYNALGYLTLKREPLVNVTLKNGFVTQLRPETTFYYDLMGNMVGTRDANGFLNTQIWNYGLDKAVVAQEFHADGGTKQYKYDSAGNQRVMIDELNRRTDYTYDSANNLIRIDRPALANGTRAVETFEYDSAGNRIAHTDALGGRERSYFDVEGRVTRTVTAEGRYSYYSYVWDTSVLSVGGVATGGWKVGISNADMRSSMDWLDVFGRTTKHTDFGNHIYTYGYNWAGLLQKQTSTAGQNIEYDYYSNALLHSVRDYGVDTESLYEYDGDGNRTYELNRSIALDYVFSNATITYDGLNRVTNIDDLRYNLTYEYDAVGNRRMVHSLYHDGLDSHQTLQEYWYEYDSMNRFTVTMGELSGGKRALTANDTSITVIMGGAGGDGVQIGYDVAGQRRLAVYAFDNRSESYAYDANGQLTDQRINGVLVSRRTNDLAGRVTNYTQWTADGRTQTTNATRSYNRDGLLMGEKDSVSGSDMFYLRSAGGTLKSTFDMTGNTEIHTEYTYEWWDSAREVKVTIEGKNPAVENWKTGTTYSNYDVNGHLTRAVDQSEDGVINRAFSYSTDAQGQVLRRDELTGVKIDAKGQITGASNDRIHRFYYIDGHRVGNVGNDGIAKVDYVQELAGKLAKGPDSKHKIYAPVATADFDENYMRIDSQYPGASPTLWTVRSGDTLQSVAAALWGDSTLWYILADANGLKSTDVLKNGTRLTVPNKVTNVHNTANTFKPYDPGKAIGDTSPTLPDAPPPPGNHGGGCGGVGLIIAVVVSVVVTVYTAGLAAESLGFVAAAGSSTMATGAAALTGGVTSGALGAATGMAAATVAGAVGAAASQVSMIATGNQSGFDWKGVALGAAGAGIGAGMGSVMNAGGQAASLGRVATQGAANSALTQGLGAMSGLQHSFDWKNVAAGAIAAGVGNEVNASAIGKIPGVGQAASGMAAGAAGTLARGGSLGRNIGAISADVVGSTIGNLAVSQIADASVPKPSLTSSLFGVGGDVDGWVQAAYPTDAGKQFGWSANNDLSTVRANAEMLGVTPERARELMTPVNNPSIVNMDIASGATAYAVPYPNIRVSELPAFTLNDRVPLAQTEGGFLRGLAGDKRSVFEAPAPLSEQIGSGVRAVGDFFAAPPIEIGNQYRDLGAHALGLSNDWRSDLGQQLAQGNYGAAALTEFGAVAGTLPLAGLGARGVASLGPTAGAMMESGVTRIGGQLYVVENGGVGSASSLPFSPLVEGGGLAAHEAAGGHLLLKHVGQSEAQLVDRFAVNPKISGSSSFYDRATAESAVSQVLSAKQSEISSWLSTSSNRLILNQKLPNSVGISVLRGETSAVNASAARVMLVRDPLMPTGYKIFTGFPTP